MMAVGSGVISCLVLLAAFGVFGQVEGVEIGRLPTEQHGVSGVLHFLDSQTLRITQFNYDGLGPGAFLYYYLPGAAVDRTGGGIIIPLPSQVGSSPDGRFQARRFTNEEFTVTMPQGTDVCDIGTLTIWCRPFRAIFTRIEISRDRFVNDGSDPCTLVDGDSPAIVTPDNFNCIPLDETLQLSWRVDNDNSQVNFRLCGCQSLKPGTNQYMGFGLSGSDSRTLMFGADPTITWVDSMSGQAKAVDYYLSGYTQCRAGIGACPDTMIDGGQCTNDVTNVTGFVSSGQQCVSFTRPFATSDTACDTPINVTIQNQYIVWGIGGLGETAFKHFTRAKSDDPPINFGRSPPEDQCVNKPLVCKGCDPFPEQCLVAREDTVFQAQIGPSGSERGYLGITGRVGWGIAWYINGVLIPELVVERGKTYTFLVEGGDTPNDLENYHPFYITNSIGGGRLQNARDIQNQETIYAGFDNGITTAVGPLCQLTETGDSEILRQQCNDFQAYVDSLVPTGSCNSPQAGRLVWTPDGDTPDTVYYQCATHLNLGWKITVVNEGDLTPQCGSGVAVFGHSLLLIAILCIATIFT